MRFRTSLCFVVPLSCAILAASAPRAMAESESGGSTIRLASAIEPVEQQSPAPEADEPPAAPTMESQIPNDFAESAPSQSPQPQSFSRPQMTSDSSVVQQGAPQQMTYARPAIDFYGARAASERLSQMPRRAAIQQNPTEPANPRRAKPFQSVRAASTVSPYLYLDRDERDNPNLPSYIAFVRPQLEQYDADHQQRLAMKQRHGRTPEPATAPRQMGETRGAARYMDTGQFYGGLR